MPLPRNPSPPPQALAEGSPVFTPSRRAAVVIKVDHDRGEALVRWEEDGVEQFARFRTKHLTMPRSE